MFVSKYVYVVNLDSVVMTLPFRVSIDIRDTMRYKDVIVRPGTTGLLIGIECSRVRDSTWLYLGSLVTTRIGAELTAVQGNYPTVL